jgi:hypothetical protein
MLCGDVWDRGRRDGRDKRGGVSPIITMRKTKPHQGGHIAKKVMWGVIII